MADKPIKVLLIEDNPGDIRLIKEMLLEVDDVPFELECTDRLLPGLERLNEGSFDVVLLDLGLPDSQGLDTFAKAHAQAPEVPIVVLTAFDDELHAIKAMRRGAQDYLVKQHVDSELLGRSIRYSIERKRAEEALRESEEKYHTLFEAVRDAIYITTREGRFVDFNPAMMELFGYPREELLRLYAQDTYVQPEDRPRFQKEIEQKGAVRDYEVKLRKKDSTEIDCLLTSTVRRAKDGSILGYQGIIRDITEQKQAEEERQHRLKVESILSEISTRFVVSSNFDEVITTTIGDIGELLKAARVYMFLYHEDKTKMSNTHEWVAPGVRSTKEMLQDLPVDMYPWWLQQLELGNNICVHDVVLLPDEAQAERALCDKLNVRALLILPIYWKSELGGFLGVDDIQRSRAWAKEDVRLLQVCAGIIGSALTRKLAENALQEAKDELEHRVEQRTAELSITNEQLRDEIIERKRVEAALRESEEQLRAQYKRIPVPTYTWERDGDDFVLVDYNDAAELITEGGIVDLLGIKARELYHDIPEILEEISRCFMKKKSIKREMLYQFKSTGQQRFLSVKYAFIPPDRVIVHTEDITARKRALEALQRAKEELELRVAQQTAELRIANEQLRREIVVRRESESKYAALVEHATDSVVIIQDGVFKFANRALEELIGYTPKEIVGKPFVDLLLPESRELLTQRYQFRMAGENPPSVYETQIQCKDGSIKDIEISAGLIQYQGRPADMGIGRDITERKRAEAARQDLEERRTNFIEITSHELRTPLTAIRGYAELLVQHLEEFDQESKDQCFEVILRNVQRLERLIAGVSTLGQFERGVFRMNIKEVGFCDFLFEALRPYQTRLGRQLEVQEVWDGRDEDPVLIEADPDRLLQVLDNLMVNAVKQTPKDRRKIIVTPEIRFNMVCVRVIDNGAGIAPEDLNRIFEPFTSIPTPYSAGGTGIGLYLSRMLVEAHGGTLTAHSAGKGQGATFILELPRKRIAHRVTRATDAASREDSK